MLILGTADWNQTIATNQHYATRELAHDFEVTFVESMGLRTPELSRRDLRRIAARVRPIGDQRASREIPTRVSVVSPRSVPYHKGIARIWNRHYLKRTAAKMADRSTFWTYSPVTYDIERFFANSVYHCVDLLGTFEGIDQKLIDREEHRLARNGVRAIASSVKVQDHLFARGFKDVTLMENVADVDALEFQMNSQRQMGAVFAGNLTDKKINFDVLEQVVATGIPLNIAGPVSEGGGDAKTRLRRLESLGARYHGVMSLQQLGMLYGSNSVGLIPYLRNAYTEGVSPLKTYEYLACGLSVVSTPLPSVMGNPDVVVAQEGEFVEATRKALSLPSDQEIRTRMEKARDHSWTKRGNQLRNFVDHRHASSQ